MSKPTCRDLGGIMKGNQCVFPDPHTAEISCPLLHGTLKGNQCKRPWSWIEWLNIGISIIFIIWIVILWYNRNNPSIWTLNYWIAGNELNDVSFWLAVGICALFTLVGGLIPVATPYIFAVGIFAYSWIQESSHYGISEIIILILICSVVKVFSDIVDYWIGYGAEKAVRTTDPTLRERWTRIILQKPKFIPMIIILFGTTPLPDEILAFPLGVVHYSQTKTWFWMFIGSVIMYTVVVLGSIGGIRLMEVVDPTGWLMSTFLILILWGCILLFLRSIRRN